MVRITEELVRKRSEHNEGIIGTLEELSLHQENIEKIEHLNNWCRELQILYLQGNIISKIENLNKLKKLQYLNLAINNIEAIENLERCESLSKLDLTLNFIGNLETVCSLKKNVHLKDLYLTGNPCAEFENYRDYVIAQLPQLENLDSMSISRSERIRAHQKLHSINDDIKTQQEKYRVFREVQKQQMDQKRNDQICDEDFWKTPSENCPETRVEIAKRQRRNTEKDDKPESQKKSIKLFNKDGRPLNINQAKVDFIFKDDNPSQFVLDIAVYKFLDTNLINIDLHPIYVKAEIKGKVFQIVFPEEISIEKSTAQRSQTTGHLVLILKKANYKLELGKQSNLVNKTREENAKPKREYLDVNTKDDMDFSKIVENHKNRVKDLYDNTEIPPLEFC